jgi:hypothetical protein
LIEDLRSIGHISPLSRFDSDLNDVEEITNSKCKKGTRLFYDPQTGVKYSAAASGYVRRYVPTKWYGGDIISKTVLNPTVGEKFTWGSGRIYTRRKFVLLLEEEDRLKLVARAVRNYRK